MVDWSEFCGRELQDQVQRNICLLSAKYRHAPPHTGQHSSVTTPSVPHAPPPLPSTHLEDGCLWVAVDGHNHLAVLHASNMLDGTTDANSYVQLGRNNLAGLTNLQPVAAASTQSRRGFRQVP